MILVRLALALTAVLGVLGIAASVWVFWPAFKGPEAAGQAIGTHRLAIGALFSVIVLSLVITVLADSAANPAIGGIAAAATNQPVCCNKLRRVRFTPPLSIRICVPRSCCWGIVTENK